MRAQGGKGTADKAMPKMKPGGVFLLLPGGEGGSLSKNPKPGVRQMEFGLMKSSVSRGRPSLRSRAAFNCPVGLLVARTS